MTAPSSAPRFRSTAFADDALRLAAVRAVVFIAEQGCPFAEEFDGLDDGALHVLGEADGEPVACARIRMIAPGLAKLERMAVLAPWRGCGHGRALLRHVMDTARKAGAQRFTLNAQCHAIPFYAAEGFVGEGPVFDEVGIPHRKMSRKA